MDSFRLSANRSQAGFTIVEMLIVLSMIGLLTAFAIPRIDLEQYEVNGAMVTIGSTLMAAQRAAVTGQHDVIVTFDAANQKMWIHEDANNNAVEDANERKRGHEFGDRVIYGRSGAPAHPTGAADITFTKTVGGLPAVTFHRSGSASQAGGFYITSKRAALAGSSEDSRFVRVERSTGRPSWFRLIGGAWKREF